MVPSPTPEQLRRASQALEEKADYLGFRSRDQTQRTHQEELRAVAAWLRSLSGAKSVQ